MTLFVLRRLGVMVLTALCLTFVVFWLTNLPPNLEKLAKSEASVRMSDDAVASWLESNGFSQPVIVRYGEWLGVLPGWTRTEDGVTHRPLHPRRPHGRKRAALLRRPAGRLGLFHRLQGARAGCAARSLSLTGWLMFWVMVVMVPTSLVLGVLSGMREGSRLDRSLSTIAIATTATPEYVSGVILIALSRLGHGRHLALAAEAGWIEGRTLFQGTATGAMDNITFWNFGLPVLTIALYGIGYIARMTRASMAEVMTQQYIRTARLKGVSFGRS
jgi:peptide/nickel transport system permease protein